MNALGEGFSQNSLVQQALGKLVEAQDAVRRILLFARNPKLNDVLVEVGNLVDQAASILRKAAEEGRPK